MSLRGRSPAAGTRRVALLLDGRWPNAHHVALALRQADVEVHFDEPAASASRAEQLAERAVDVRADVVLPTSGESVAELATIGGELAAALARRGSACKVAAVPSRAALRVCDDKGELARLLAERGLPTPQTMEADESRVRAALASGEFAYPFLLKPRRGWAGVGIRAIHNEAQLDAAYAAGGVSGRTFLAQAFVPGYDVDCSVLCDRGRVVAHTVQRTRLARYDFGPPVVIEFVDGERVAEVTRHLMATLGWHGVAHVDLRHDRRDGSVNVVEVNGRYWASVGGSVAAGVNFPQLHAMQALGETVPGVSARRGWAMCPPPPGDGATAFDGSTQFWRSGLGLRARHPRQVGWPMARQALDLASLRGRLREAGTRWFSRAASF